MDYVRGILFGYSKGETLATYWKKHNTDYATVDVQMCIRDSNAVEGLYTDPLQMKEKSNTGKYLKYRPKPVSYTHLDVYKRQLLIIV